MKSIVYGFKYKKLRVLSDKLGTFLSERLAQNCDNNSEIILVPVPLHPFRLLTRGFNQAELLGKQVEKVLGFKLIPALKRTKATTPQFGLTKNLRRGNMKNAFTFNARYHDAINNKTVVLIDDIIATGSTISECAKTLKQNGAKEVWALVLSKA
jgi:competence protein ComFC